MPAIPVTTRTRPHEVHIDNIWRQVYSSRTGGSGIISIIQFGPNVYFIRIAQMGTNIQTYIESLQVWNEFSKGFMKRLNILVRFLIQRYNSLQQVSHNANIIEWMDEEATIESGQWSWSAERECGRIELESWAFVGDIMRKARQIRSFQLKSTYIQLILFAAVMKSTQMPFNLISQLLERKLKIIPAYSSRAGFSMPLKGAVYCYRNRLFIAEQV